ncbi:MAG TPA: branched-chain amino acid ABC transporter permease [Candidatus Acidoferrales bacterium]|nr:branched-chain amino acid ABC transporter permease [Candidatus Acidoferrales bacterium]
MLNLLLQAAVDGILIGLVYAVMSVGLSLSMGILGVLNVSHSAFIMLGSFFALGMLVFLHLDPVIAFVLAVPLFFVVGAAVHRLLIRRVERAPATIGILILFGLMVVIETGGILAWTTDTRVLTTGYTNLHFALGPLTIGWVQVLAGLLALALTGAIYAFLRFTMNGRAILAMAQNRDAAAMLGMDTDRLAMIVFGIGIGAAGAGGVAIAMIFPFDPQDQIQWLSWAFLVVVLGGLGRVENTLLAGLVIGLIQSLAGTLLPFRYVYLILYLLLFAILVVRGEGLSGVRRRAL